MLDERTLVRAALCVSFAGLLALFLVLRLSELPLEHLQAVSDERQGETVRVRGTVVASRIAGNGTVTIITIAEPIERQVVAFEAFNVSVGSQVQVEGEVREYRGEAELVASRISPAAPRAPSATR